MSIPAQGAVGAETMTAGQPVIRKAVFEIASRRIKSGAPGLAPATAEAIARIIGLEAAKALASPRADSDERTAGEALKEACKPWEHYTGEPPDDGSPLSGVFVAGMVYTERPLAKLLDVAHYEGGDGSEDFDADATQTLRNILIGARLWDADENRPVSATPAQPAGAVPDSLRAMSEAASAGRFKVIRGLHDYAVVPEARDQKGPVNSADADFIVAAVNFVRTLLATHPAGQSAGSGAQRAELVRHVKRGTEYEVLHRGAQLQVSTAYLGQDFALGENASLVIYRGEDGQVWAREEEEFDDGRFVPAPPASSGQGGR